jgi:hypothetical protein
MVAARNASSNRLVNPLTLMPQFQSQLDVWQQTQAHFPSHDTLATIHTPSPRKRNRTSRNPAPKAAHVSITGEITVGQEQENLTSGPRKWSVASGPLEKRGLVATMESICATLEADIPASTSGSKRKREGQAADRES